MTYTEIPIFALIEGTQELEQVGAVLISSAKSGLGYRVYLSGKGRVIEGLILENDLDRLLETYDYSD